MNQLADRLVVAREAMADWDGARSQRVFVGAVRSRAARAHRQRLVAVACAASAALFLFAVRSLGPNFSTTHFDSRAEKGESSSNDNGPGATPSNGAMPGMSIAMNADLFADGGREAD